MTTPATTLSLADLEAQDPGSGAGNERRYLCPHCGPEHRQDAAHRSLAVNIASGAYVCHRCGNAGLLSEHQTRRPNPSFTGRAIARPPRPVPATHRLVQPELPPEPASGSAPWAHLHLGSIVGSPGEAYLASRGLPLPLPPGVDVRWCADFGPEGKPGRPAVVFALREGSGTTVAAQGRFLAKHAPKCQSLGPVSHGLFATPGALDAAVLVVTEAPLDALAMAAAGVPALATCGTRAAWPVWLALAGRTVVLAQDADDAGDKQAAALGHAAAKAGATVFRLRPPVKDWAQSVEQRGWPALREALVAAVSPESRPSAPDSHPGPCLGVEAAPEAPTGTGGEAADLCRVCGVPVPTHDHWRHGWVCRCCWPAVAENIGPVVPDGTLLSDADREALVAWGLTVGRCATCGQEDTLPAGKPTRPCRMTSGCKGTVRSISVPGSTRGDKEKGEPQ